MSEIRQCEGVAAMRMMRGIVILGLMLSLPALAVYGNVDGLLSLLRAESGVAVASDAKASGDAATPAAELPRPGQDPLLRESAEGPSVYPTFKPKTAPPTAADASALGKRLRPAIYRPLADGDVAAICRVAAHREGQAPERESSAPDVLAEMGRQLQTLGAQRYRMDEVSGDAHFICEFPSPQASGQPLVFQARCADRAQAMRDVLRQVRAWDGGITR